MSNLGNERGTISDLWGSCRVCAKLFGTHRRSRVLLNGIALGDGDDEQNRQKENDALLHAFKIRIQKVFKTTTTKSIATIQNGVFDFIL